MTNPATGARRDRRLASAARRIAELEAEVERLKREGTPGVMHEVDRAFYDLAIKERDYWRAKAERA